METETLVQNESVTEGFSSDELQLVSFCIGSEEYGVDILQVQEINRMVDITKVPQAPRYVEGVINLRGKVIPIIDLRKRFNLELKEHDKNTRIVVVDIGGNIMGMIVDSVSEVLRIPEETVEPPSPIMTTVDSAFLTGIAKIDGSNPEHAEGRLIILLDLEKVLSPEEKAHLQSVSTMQPETDKADTQSLAGM